MYAQFRGPWIKVAKLHLSPMGEAPERERGRGGEEDVTTLEGQVSMHLTHKLLI